MQIAVQETKRSPYGPLLADPDVKRWKNNVARGSVITSDVYLRRLGHFCESQRIKPKELLSFKPKEIEGLLMDLVSKMQSEGYAGSYISSQVKSVKSWLNFNDIEIKPGKIKIEAATDAPTLREERIPSIEELGLIFRSATKQQRVECALIAHAGLRPECQGDYLGIDGLTLQDLPEMKIEGSEITFAKVPAMIIIRRGLSKAGHQFFSFLNVEACQYVYEYLQGRIRTGEILGPTSPLVTPKLAEKPFLRTTNIGDGIRTAIRKAGFTWRPYVLRSFFDTQMMIAESKGLILRDYRVFWMGHKGDIENRYTTNKCRLSPDVQEDMRAAYAKASKYLITSRSTQSQEDSLTILRREILFAVGYSEDELAKMNLSEMSQEDFSKKLKEKSILEAMNHGLKQKVILVSEVESYIAQGFEFIAALPNDRAIVKVP